MNSSTKKIADAEEKTNENDADSQEQIRQLTSNENMIGYPQLTMHNLIVIKKIPYKKWYSSKNRKIICYTLL